MARQASLMPNQMERHGIVSIIQLIDKSEIHHSLLTLLLEVRTEISVVNDVVHFFATFFQAFASFFIIFVSSLSLHRRSPQFQFERNYLLTSNRQALFFLFSLFSEESPSKIGT